MAARSPPPFTDFLAIRYWPTWAGIALLYLIAWLPFRLRMICGGFVGWLSCQLAHERRYITAVNIALCFPELDAQEQAALVRRCFRENGIGLIETATGWVRPPAHFRDQVILKGTQHLDAALAQGRGLLLLGAHYSTLDFGANLLSLHYPFAVTYRAHKNPLFDAFMLRGRLQNCNGVFDRKDIRGAFRHLKQGKILWYAPDQDYGPEQAVFVPFFAHTAATITAASRFAAFNKSPVVIVRQGRNSAKKLYELEFSVLDAPFPSGDDCRDAERINVALERAIRVYPAQYLWMHKRFKTQPAGKPASPYIFIKTPDKKLSESQYTSLLVNAARCFDGEQARSALLLQNGLLLREFKGLPGRLSGHKHAARLFDLRSKQLRSNGIRTFTVDNIFRIPSRNLTALTLFPIACDGIGDQAVDSETAARFLARLHNGGFHFARIDAGNLCVTADDVAIRDPLYVNKVPGSAAWHQRVDDLCQWCVALNCSPERRQKLLQCYLPLLRATDAAGVRALLARHPVLAHNAPTRLSIGRTLDQGTGGAS